MSNRAMGALEFKPARGPKTQKLSALEMGSLVTEARKMLKGQIQDDDHAKNISFLLREGSSWELAPAYDLTFTHNPQSEWTNQHLMSVNGKYKDFTIEDLLTVADRFGIGEATQVIDEIRTAIQAWPSFANQARVNPKELDRIGKLHLLLM